MENPNLARAICVGLHCRWVSRTRVEYTRNFFPLFLCHCTNISCWRIAAFDYVFAHRRNKVSARVSQSPWSVREKRGYVPRGLARWPRCAEISREEAESGFTNTVLLTFFHAASLPPKRNSQNRHKSFSFLCHRPSKIFFPNHGLVKT